MEILLCLFNSPIYTFVYQKKFKSKKVLKQHFQDFPLPLLTSDLIQSFNEVYTEIMSGTKNQEDADKLICNYFGISKIEYNYINQVIIKKNKLGKWTEGLLISQPPSLQS